MCCRGVDCRAPRQSQANVDTLEGAWKSATAHVAARHTAASTWDAWRRPRHWCADLMIGTNLGWVYAQSSDPCRMPIHHAGYYMAMACSKIVAEALTITGSIGVISGKFSLASLYERVGYSKTTLSRGRCTGFRLLCEWMFTLLCASPSSTQQRQT